VPNLDILPFPDLIGFDYFKNMEIDKNRQWLTNAVDVVSMNISRSCPFSCTFCTRAERGPFRQMSIDKIFEQIDWMLSLHPNFEGIHFNGELTFASRQFTLEFCQRIKPYNLKWYASMHVNQVSEKLFMAMKDGGCVLVMLGIESGDDRILKSMNKHSTVKQAGNAIKIAADVGLDIRGILVFGDPEETWDTFNNTVKWEHKSREWFELLPKSNMLRYLVVAYPGTQLYKDACEKGLIKNPVNFLKEELPYINLTKFTDQEYNKMYDLVKIERSGEKIKNAYAECENDYTVNVTGICAKCGNALSFTQLKEVFPSFMAYSAGRCHSCNERHNISPIMYCDIEKLSKNIKALVDKNTVAVWSVTDGNFFKLLDIAPALHNDNVWFVNKVWKGTSEGALNPARLGKNIFTPDIINSENIHTVIVPNSPEEFNDIKATIATDFPQVKRVVHITELL